MIMAIESRKSTRCHCWRDYYLDVLKTTLMDIDLGMHLFQTHLDNSITFRIASRFFVSSGK